MTDQRNKEIELLDKIRDGDKQAFRALFDRFYQLLLSIAINLLGDFNSAKDATQEVFLTIWRRREQLNIHSSLEAFLKKSVINRCLNIIKSRKAFVSEAQLVELPNRDNPQEDLEVQDLESIVEAALNTLPDRCRTIFILRRLEGHSLKEIAEKLEISPKTVENQITKALKVLQKAVQPYLESEKNEL